MIFVDREACQGVQIVSKHILLPFGTTQLRCFQPGEYLRASGIKVSFGRLYRSIPKKCCIVILHRAIFDSYTNKFIKYAKSRGCVVVYDTDDLIFDTDVSEYLSFVSGVDYQRMISLHQAAMKTCDAILVSTSRLLKSASRFHNDVRVIRNGLSSEYFNNSNIVARYKISKSSKSVTVAYLSGSASHDRDFKLVEESLLRLLKESGKVKVLLVGTLNFSKDFFNFAPRFEYRQFVPYDQLPNLYGEIDINLIPLETDQDFCQAKSELKFIEAGICGVPSIASPTEVHKQVIENNVNGISVQNNCWYEAIKNLVENDQQRNEIGRQVRSYVESHYSPSLMVQEWQMLMSEIWATYGKANKNRSKNKILSQLISRFDLEILRSFRRLKIIISSVLKPIR